MAHLVKASETTDGEKKFSVNSCKDVQDAWGLRGHTDNLKISKDTLAKRIQKKAKEMGCQVPGESEKSKK